VHAYDPLKLGGFHPVTISAGGYRSVGFTFHTNPRACRSAGDQSSASSIDSVTVHFTTLKLFHDTQTVPLGDMSFFLSSPTVAACTG
jgi:hypothetical protein